MKANNSGYKIIKLYRYTLKAKNLRCLNTDFINLIGQFNTEIIFDQSEVSDFSFAKDISYTLRGLIYILEHLPKVCDRKLFIAHISHTQFGMGGISGWSRLEA